MSRHHLSKGFTLVEVLVALLVLVLAMSALQLKMAQYLDSSGYLRDRTIASWVAANQLELLRLSSRLGNPVPSQEISGSAEMAGRRWYWSITPVDTQADATLSTIVPVFIGVSADSAEAARTSPLYTLTGVTDAAWML